MPLIRLLFLLWFWPTFFGAAFTGLVFLVAFLLAILGLFSQIVRSPNNNRIIAGGLAVRIVSQRPSSFVPLVIGPLRDYRVAAMFPDWIRLLAGPRAGSRRSHDLCITGGCGARSDAYYLRPKVTHLRALNDDLGGLNDTPG